METAQVAYYWIVGLGLLAAMAIGVDTWQHAKQKDREHARRERFSKWEKK